MRNYVSIECLRAYLAWWVVLGHASQLVNGGKYLPERIVGVLERTDRAVNVFIIVSGFVITHMVISRNERYMPYLTRRAFRIVPIYLFCIAVAVVVSNLYHLAFLNPWASDQAMRSARVAAESEHFGTYLLIHLTLLQGLVPEEVLPFSATAILAPAWSLSLEWQFYLVAPLLIAFVAGQTWRMLSTVCFALLALMFFRTGLLGHWQYLEFLPLAIQYFLIGIITRLAIAQPHRAEYYLVLAGLVLFAGKLEIAIWAAFTTCALAESGLIRLAAPLDLAGRIFATNRHVAGVGSWSYSTYLIHIPIFSIVIGGYAALFGDLTQDKAFLLVLLCLPIVLSLSWLLYRSIEQPCNRLGRTLSIRMVTAQPAVAGAK